MQQMKLCKILGFAGENGAAKYVPDVKRALFHTRWKVRGFVKNRGFAIFCRCFTPADLSVDICSCESFRFTSPLTHFILFHNRSEYIEDRRL